MYKIEPKNIVPFINDSSIKLPRFQRKQTWDDKKNFELCISIFKNYPLGVVIVNKEEDENNRTTNWLLDGRQRRNALTHLYKDPEEIYIWAKKYIGFKSSDQPADIEDKFWEKITDYLEEEELDQSESNESGDESKPDPAQPEDEGVVPEPGDDEGTVVATSRSRLELLLNIIKTYHPKQKRSSGFTRPFDFTKNNSAINENKISFLEKDAGYTHLNSRKLKIFIDSYDNYCKAHEQDKNDEKSFLAYCKKDFNISDTDPASSQLDLFVSKNWKSIKNIFEILQSVEELLYESTIATIQVDGLSPVDSQKIFNIINTKGTKLSAVEILSAKPSWNKEILNPSTKQKEAATNLYKVIGTSVMSDAIVKWDLPATFINRIEHSNIFFRAFDYTKATDFERSLTIGFKLLSGIYKNGITKEDVDSLSRMPASDWIDGYEDLIRNINLMTKLLLDNNFYKYFVSWKFFISDILSDAPTLNYFLLLFKDYQKRNFPVGSSKNAKEFQRNSVILLDKLIYEYVTKEWRGSSDSKIANNLKKFSTDYSGVFDPVPETKWLNLLNEIFDKDKLNDADLNQKIVEPILKHYYCLSEIEGPNLVDGSKASIEVDHIIPQSDLEKSTYKMKTHNLYNLCLLPKRENASKGDKRLNTIDDVWLRQQITKFSSIPEERFDEFSKVPSIEQLKELRAKLFIRAFSECRKKYIEIS